MKTWILVRHAKSSWEYDVKDLDRPLSPRGIHDAKMVSKALARKKLDVDAVFSSPANRAMHTALIFLRHLGIDSSQLQINKALYDFGGSSLENFVRSLPDSISTLLTFGHNHACTALAHKFGLSATSILPTSSTTILQFDVPLWADIDKAKWECLTPKTLKKI